MPRSITRPSGPVGLPAKSLTQGIAEAPLSAVVRVEVGGEAGPPQEQWQGFVTLHKQLAGGCAGGGIGNSGGPPPRQPRLKSFGAMGAPPPAAAARHPPAELHHGWPGASLSGPRLQWALGLIVIKSVGQRTHRRHLAVFSKFESRFDLAVYSCTCRRVPEALALEALAIHGG